MNDETLNISTLQTELAETEAAKLETEAHLRDANEKIKSLETELIQVKASRLDNEHDISDHQATLDAEKETHTLLHPIADAVYQHICTHLAGDYGLKGLPTAIRLFSEAYTEQKAILEGYKEAAANVDETYQSDLSHAEGLHARCEEEKKHLDAKYQALVKEAAQWQPTAITEKESMIRQALESVTYEGRISRYALEHVMTLYDSEVDRNQDLICVIEELKKALKEAEDALKAKDEALDFQSARVADLEATDEPA